MHLRRSLALVSGALLLTAPLTSCGMDPASDRVNQIVVGVNDRDAAVDVLNAVVVSAQEGSGTFLATFVNNDTSEDASVEALQSADPEVAQVADFSTITLAPGQLVNLAAEDQEAFAVEGELAAGDFVPMTLELSDGEILELDVPVVPACDEYEGLDRTAATAATSEQCEIAHSEGEH